MRIKPQPVFLYFDPHPIHEKMAEHIGAEKIQCQTGGILERVIAANSHDFSNRPLIMEGGVPLVEGALTRILKNCGPLIALGADSTYHDLVDPIPSRTRKSRLAHRVTQRWIDGTLAVSERIATIAERFNADPVRIVHPFVAKTRREWLRSIDPNISGNRVLSVGKYREKNGQDILRKALDHTNMDLRVDFVGPDTERIESSENIRTHGFVSDDRLKEFFAEAAVMVFPAPVGAFPVVTLEALTAGLPVITTPRIGTATLIRGIHGRLIADPTPKQLAQAIDWYINLSIDDREQLSRRAGYIGTGFSEPIGLESFGVELLRLFDELGYEVDVLDA